MRSAHKREGSRSPTLLAAFPELKAKFQAAIRAAVNKAVDTVNKLADGLKKAVQAALDLLGKAIDAALSLLENGLHAIVDLAADVVQGAIDAAKSDVQQLGDHCTTSRRAAAARDLVACMAGAGGGGNVG